MLGVFQINALNSAAKPEVLMIEIVKRRGVILSYYVVTYGGEVVHFDFDARDVWKFTSQASAKLAWMSDARQRFMPGGCGRVRLPSGSRLKAA